jgi:hypothetical protein
MKYDAIWSTAADSEGRLLPAVSFSTNNTIPVADAGDPVSMTAGSIQLDGSNSSDADGDAITYQWSLVSQPEGSALDLPEEDLTESKFTVGLSTVGDYVFSLTVSDAVSSSSPSTVTITVTD